MNLSSLSVGESGGHLFVCQRPAPMLIIQIVRSCGKRGRVLSDLVRKSAKTALFERLCDKTDHQDRFETRKS
jgi:hypothetical protein